MDIVVTLPKSKGGVDHLLEKIVGDSWWRMKRFPTKFDEETDKVFILAEGKVRGFFTVFNIEFSGYRDEYTLIFDEWTDIKHISMKGFQGFRYRKFGWENKT